MDAPDRNTPIIAFRGLEKEFLFCSQLKAHQITSGPSFERAQSNFHKNCWFKEGELPKDFLDRIDWETLERNLSDTDWKADKEVIFRAIIKLDEIHLKKDHELQDEAWKIIKKRSKSAKRGQNKQRFDYGTEHFVIMPGDGYAYTVLPIRDGRSDASFNYIETQYIQEKAPAKILYKNDNLIIFRTPEYDTHITTVDIRNFSNKPNVAPLNYDTWLIYNSQTGEFFQVSDIRKNCGKDWEGQIWIFDGRYHKLTEKDFIHPILKAGKSEIEQKMEEATKMPAQS